MSPLMMHHDERLRARPAVEELGLGRNADELAIRHDEVTRRALAILAASPYTPVRQLVCCHANGVLTISGNLPRFYLKQHALTLAKKVPGVYRVDDRIEVNDIESGSSGRPAFCRKAAVVEEAVC